MVEEDPDGDMGMSLRIADGMKLRLRTVGDMKSNLMIVIGTGWSSRLVESEHHPCIASIHVDEDCAKGEDMSACHTLGR